MVDNKHGRLAIIEGVADYIAASAPGHFKTRIGRWLIDAGCGHDLASKAHVSELVVFPGCGRAD